DERTIERAAPIVEQQRILVRPLGNDALSEAGDEHDAERAAARLMRRADEHASVPARGRLPVERDEPIVQDVARFLERHRPDAATRPRAGGRTKDPPRTSERAAGQPRKPVEPVAP